MPVETVLVDLLAPAARELGLLWEDDRCDFLEVTMGVWRLQEIVHEIAGRRVTSLRAGRTPRRILLANMSGDQHGFALVLLEHLFELAGWETDRLSPDDGQDMTRCVAQDWYDVIGLTVSCDCHMGPLPSVIHALRSVSKNPRLRVMVGGGAFARSAVVAADVGADGFAADVRQAVTVAATLVEAAETRN
jgi:methanogenic corrinoid protein MtbC1